MFNYGENQYLGNKEIEFNGNMDLEPNDKNVQNRKQRNRRRNTRKKKLMMYTEKRKIKLLTYKI